jgi:hypothetical protein
VQVTAYQRTSDESRVALPSSSRNGLSAEWAAAAATVYRSPNLQVMLGGEPMVPHAAIVSDLFAMVVYERSVSISEEFGHDAPFDLARWSLLLRSTDDDKVNASEWYPNG